MKDTPEPEQKAAEEDDDDDDDDDEEDTGILRLYVFSIYFILY